MREVRRKFELDDEPTELIGDFDDFREALDGLVYSEVIGSQED
jgi:hypothetical protein